MDFGGEETERKTTMTTIDIIITSIYVVGFVLGAIGMGFYMRGGFKDGNLFDLFYDIMPLLAVLIFWPFVLVVCAGVAAIFLVGIAPCWIVKRLINFGGWLWKKWDEWRGRRWWRKQQKEEERKKEIEKDVAKMQKALKKGRKGDKKQ